MRHDDVDRREGRRATGVVGSASVVFRGQATTFTVRDLSSGGALLIGRHGLSRGERIEVFFDADRDRLTGIRIYAEVVRCEALPGGSYAIGAAFRDLPAEIRDHVEELVVAALERCRAAAPATVLVVDTSPQTRHALVRDLRPSRMRVVSAATPLEVVRHLHDPDHRVEAALVDVRFREASGVAVLDYLADEHPNVRRILIAERTGFHDFEPVLSAGHAHALLTRPWERQCLLAALGAR